MTRPSKASALGRARALLLHLPVVGDWPRRRRALRRVRVGCHRYLHARAVLGDEGLRVDAELLGSPRLERLDPQPLLGAGDLVAVDDVGQLLELGDELTPPRPHREHLALAHRAGLLGGLAFVRGGGE